MTAAAALRVLGALAEHGVDACVGGGWAVDALLEAQTRAHSDLDLWLAAADAEPVFVAVARYRRPPARLSGEHAAPSRARRRRLSAPDPFLPGSHRCAPGAGPGARAGRAGVPAAAGAGGRGRPRATAAPAPAPEG
jgi:hypothetical protein